MRQMLRALPREFDTTAVTVRHAPQLDVGP